MKFTIIATPLLLATSALAQGILIGTPQTGQALTIGKRFTVEVDKPDSIASSQSIAVAISLQLCQSDGCSMADNDGKLGQVLFAGTYSPKFHGDGKPPYQNYTVTVPSGIPPQNAVLHVIHFWLVGAGPFPTLQARNVSVILKQ